MEEYIRKLYYCGIPMHTAYCTCWDMLKNFGFEALDEFVSEMVEQKGTSPLSVEYTPEFLHELMVESGLD